MKIYFFSLYLLRVLKMRSLNLLVGKVILKH